LHIAAFNGNVNVIRLLLNPVDGVDGLYLVPAGATVYALAYGPGAGTGELCQALMAAARDGHLGEGFEIADVSPTSVPCGAGRRLTAQGLVAVGPAAFGHPLQLGLSDTLAGCTRAAIAMAEGSAADARALERRYVREGLQDLLQDAGAGVRHQGAVADQLYVQRPYERAVDALLGDWLQHVVVERSGDVTDALASIAGKGNGRCGFLILDEAATAPVASARLDVPSGATALSAVVQARGPQAATIGRLIGDALIVESFDAAQALARTVRVPVVTMDGSVFHGAWQIRITTTRSIICKA
jgi:hypothetical protein